MKLAAPASVLLLGSLAAAQSYEIELLDTGGSLVLDYPKYALPGGAGWAVGGGLTPGAPWSLPVVWQDGVASVLPLLPGDEAGEALGGDGLGTVVGTSVSVTTQGQLTFFFEEAVLWTDGGPPVLLESLVQSGPALELFNAVRIDSAGVITGVARDAAILRLRTFRLDGGMLEDIGSLIPDAQTMPADANEAGQVVGHSVVDGGRDHAFLWDAGVMTDLHIQGVPGLTSRANAIDEQGRVVGSADFVPDFITWETAALWQNGQVQELGTLGGQQSWAYGINASGDVAGGSVAGDGTNRAFLWRAGTMYDLNQLIPPGSGWWLLAARDIDDQGRIYGEGSTGGSLRAFVLTPECDTCLRYCISTPNSTGSEARIEARGWPSVGANVLELEAAPVPAGQSGLFYYGPDQTQVPFGLGFRCVGGGSAGLFRLPLVTADAGEVLASAFDLGDPPGPAGQILPGSTWNVQGWFRDPAAGGASFNLSDALSITFLP